MLKDSSYERVYTGSQIEVAYVRGLLQEKGIHAVVRNDFESGLRGGFGASPDNVKLFVQKQDIVTSKRLVETAFENGIPDEILEEQATKSRLAEQDDVQKKATRPLIQKEDKAPTRSIFNIILNIGLIIYSAWRLSPLLNGEEVPTFRIILSGAILVFCVVALVNHFRRKA